MKTVYITIAGTFALAGAFAFERNKSERLVTVPAQKEVLWCVPYDTIPGKTVYRDLNSGETIDIWYDKVGMRTLNKKTGGPVEFYINTSTQDTVFGRGRFIVNNHIIKGEDGKWKLDDGKVKVDGDELKVKAGDQKFKIDGDEVKIKGNGVKAKTEDGEVKIKSKDGKAKYEDDKTKIKTKDSLRPRQ
jgi:hypothetical protein